MWGDPGPDPGGTKSEESSPGPPSNQELSDLKDQFEQQQVLIAQLKEMLRKTEQTNVTQEKVEEYANTLTRMSERAKKSKTKRLGMTGHKSDSSAVDTPASEKIMLLRQQLEENKLKLAQRGKFQKGIEETVTQLKAQLNDSQQLISQTPLNLSVTDVKVENYSVYSNPEDFINLLVNKDRKIAEQNARIQKLEANVLDLQENVKEKDSVIDARTKAITLMTESLSKKGKNTLDALDDTKEQMRKMQENFVSLEFDMKNRQQVLLRDLQQRNSEIERLQLENKILEAKCTDNQDVIVEASYDLNTNSQITTLKSRIVELEGLINNNASTTELSEKDSEIICLKEANNALKENCEKLESDLELLNNLLDKYKNDLANYEIKLADPTTSSVDADNSKNLYNKLEALNSRIVELENLNLQLQTKSSSRDSPQRTSKKGKRGQRSQNTQENKIAELQKIIDDDKSTCDSYRAKILEYEMTIGELNLTIEKLKSKQDVDKPLEENVVAGNEEIAKFKKQLDESNKNMIKIKAQHKSKVKELNKKIDELKKASDNNAEITRLQAENSQLNERVDALEEEKVNLGLDASYSVKDLGAMERVKELEVKLLEQSELLDLKDQSIETLKNQIESHKVEYQNLTERFEKLSHLENAQVISEITSIHFEEQLDTLEIEKNRLTKEKEEIILEKEALLEKIDNLNKEKQELSVKLENYMQENMDLIDKLEKLSAEKVSSAESIEIVEALTQQEKLELEAYQESLELNAGNIKIADENIEQNPELNESVNQLTEETSDLLRKIELFTEERREVMDKMEALASENNQLNLKINEIENNRDILAETYEQLQNEKEELEQKLEQEKKRVKDLDTLSNELKAENEILKQKSDGLQIKRGSQVEEMIKIETVTPLTAAVEEKTSELQKRIDEYKSLVEIQKLEIQELKLELLSHQDLSVANSELHEKICSIQTQYEALSLENETLKQSIKRYSEIVSEKNELESDLINAKKRIDDFEEKLADNISEIKNYKLIIEDNKNELISSANLLADLHSKLNEKQNEILNYTTEITHLNSVVTELNSAISHLENENRQNNEKNESMEVISNQLQDLKVLLNENIKQIEEYEIELQQNSEVIAKLNIQLKDLNRKLLDMEHELECKDDEIKKLNKERDNKETMINNLQEELKHKDEIFHKTCDTLKEKYLLLQNQIEQNAGSLNNIKDPLSKIQELEMKNKEQLEKMKKIAANLKKKTTAYQELEQKYLQNKEKWEQEENEKLQLQEVIIIKEEKITSLVQEINEIKVENEKLKNLNQKYKDDINNIAFSSDSNIEKIKELCNTLEYKEKIIHHFEDRCTAMQCNTNTTVDALEAKLREQELVIETKESELYTYKEKVIKLEEELRAVEERHLSLEHRAVDLGEKLQEKSKSFTEVSETGYILEQRLLTLMEHDEAIGKNLESSQNENKKLYEYNHNLTEENNKLKHELSVLTKQKLENSEEIECLQNKISQLDDVITKLDSENKCLHLNYEKKLNDIKQDEAFVIELQTQMEQIENERKVLTTQCEKLHDSLKMNSESRELLNEELEQYKQKLDQQQIDFDAQIINFQKLSDENNKNMILIEQLNLNLDSNLIKIKELENNCILLEDKLKVVSSELDVSNKQVDEFKNTNCDLQTYISELSQKLQMFENTVTKTTETGKDNITTFTWPGETNNDPFDFVATQMKDSLNIEPSVSLVSEPLLQSQNPEMADSHESSKEVLLNKIKTLEFMVYNLEKEKEDILLQCQELTNEVARLIYEKQNTNITLETQICSPEETTLTNKERLQLQEIEFAQAKELSQVSSENKQPVVEEILLPTSTYLCYKPEDSSNTNVRVPEIISSDEANITSEDLKQLQQFEFEKTEPYKDVTDSSNPVTEEVSAKPMYLCYKFEDPSTSSCELLQQNLNYQSTLDSQRNESIVHQVSLDAFDENDDGWGCGAEEAKLEEDHRQKMENKPHKDSHNLQVREAEERIRVLELERERHLEEIKQAQIKSGKLIKKLKELKVANEKLTYKLKKTSDFGDLDDAIQEELKSQVACLEKRIKETHTEFEKEKNEKNSLLKRIEVLQAANDRMVDMKQKQDVEILSWQRQNRELNAKLEQFEWGDGGFDTPKHAISESTVLVTSDANVENLEKKIQDLTETVKDLTLDNEELQAMLEEQRMLRLNSKKIELDKPASENTKTETEYLNVVMERDLLITEKEELQYKLNLLIQTSTEVEQTLQRLTEEKSCLESQVGEINKTYSELIEQLTVSNNESENMKQIIFNLECEKNDLNNHIEILKNASEELSNKNTALNKLEETIEKLNQEKADLHIILQEKDTQFEHLSKSTVENDKLRTELEQKLLKSQSVLSEIEEKLKIKELEVVELQKTLNVTLEERSMLTVSLQQVTDEWTQRVDQRGNDVAESWKLHLESRETEFLQKEQELKKEINELEEKCNALVNENNELRKNVDAEIKNEVDRMSALQQQINDRQQYINELNRILQETQTKFEEQNQKSLDCECRNVQLLNQLEEREKKIADYELIIVSLKSEIEEKARTIEDLTKQLQQLEELHQQISEMQVELNEKQNKLEIVGVELNKYDEKYSSLLQQLQNKDSYILEMTNNLEDVNTKYKEACNTIQNLKEQIIEVSTDLEADRISIRNYSESITELNTEMSHLKQLLKDKEDEKQTESALLKQLCDSSKAKDEEIDKLNTDKDYLASLLDSKEKEFTSNLETTMQESELILNQKSKEFLLMKQNYEQLLTSKDDEITNLQFKLTQQIQIDEDTLNEFKVQLDLKTQECDSLQNKLLEENTLHTEESKQLSELRGIIENQVIKIESLKEELLDKSKDYDALIAELDIRKSVKIQPHITQQQPSTQENRVETVEYNSSTEDNLTPISRAELDLALYMLHQRDVRCEELTVELMQLLEERDTLQLKLSNAIREKEEWKNKFSPTAPTTYNAETEIFKTSSPMKSPTKSKASAIVLGATGTELATEATEHLQDPKETDQLANKLSELKSVGYGKDKTLLDEQQQRRLQQLSLMQQHRDVAALLPPEAAAKLVQEASYTLSRDVQSPSKVLLNWLWGKSTPKVNDI